MKIEPSLPHHIKEFKDSLLDLVKYKDVKDSIWKFYAKWTYCQRCKEFDELENRGEPRTYAQLGPYPRHPR